MSGVNDLARQWAPEGEDYPIRGTYDDGMADCAADLDHTARTAWHPVSEPPSVGGDEDLVLVWQPGWTECMVDRVGNVRLRALRGDSVMQWAHQRDVVLLPPQSTTGEG